MASFPSSGLRRGKWTAEEETYATRVILAFKDGLLDVAPGTSLRSYLSDKLNCAPMRISKKFSGDASIRRSAFHPREDASPATIERSRREIAELEEAWRRKLGILPGSSHTMSSAAGHRKRARADSDDSDEEEEEDDDDKVEETEKEEEDPRHPLISEDMAAVVGVSRANHFRLVKLLWKYIKAHDLQNPSNRNEILCDATLQKVFKRKKVPSFGMSKLLGAHIFKEAAAAAEAERRRRAARDMPSMSLIDACDKGRTDIVQAWLDNGADVDRAEHDWTPLQSACYFGHVDAARLLLDKGAEVDLANEDGETPLFLACARGHADVARLLRDCGADVDRANKKEDEADEDEEKKFPYKSITFYVNAGSDDEIISDSESDSVGYHRTTYERSIFGRPAFKSIRTPKYGGETIVFETPRKWYDIQPHEHRVDMEPMGEYGRRIPYKFMEQAITFGFHYEMEDIDTLEKLDVDNTYFEGETRTGGHVIWHSHDHSQQKNYQFVGYEVALSKIEKFEADEDRKKCLEQFYEESGDWPCVRYELRRKPRTKNGLQIKFIDAKLVRMESPDHCIQRLELAEGWDR